MALLRLVIEFNQEDHKGKAVQIKATVEKDMNESEIENLDMCEKSLLQLCYAGMREGIEQQMSYVSKKKVLSAQLKENLK